ncbi:MAG: redoxin domain-containing protein [Paludibacteraceae bacterium]
MIRTFLLLLLLSIGIIISAQTGYTLSGKVENGKNAVLAYLFYPKSSGEYAVDSCYIKDNRFSFSGKVEYPVMTTLIVRSHNISTEESPSQVFNFYLENKPVAVSLNLSNAAITVSGSHTHDLHMEFLKLLEPIKKEMNSIQTAYRNATPEQQISQTFNDSIMRREQSIHAMNSQSIHRFVMEHSNDFFSLYLLQTQLDNEPEDERILPLFSDLSKTIRNTTLGKNFADKLQKQQATSTGSIAPYFEGEDIDGNPVKLSDFRGKYLLILFWSSDCDHCLNELPDIEKIFKQFTGENFTILAIAQDAIDRKNNWAEFVKARNLPWTNLFDERINNKKKFAMLYNVQRIPTNFLLDKDGKIMAKNLYGEKLVNKLTAVGCISN